MTLVASRKKQRNKQNKHEMKQNKYNNKTDQNHGNVNRRKKIMNGKCKKENEIERKS